MAVAVSGWKLYASLLPTIQDTQFVIGSSVAIGGNVNRTLATINTNDVIVVMLTHARSSSGTSVIGTVTSPNLTFTQQVTMAHTTNGESRIYTAVAGGSFSNEVITATNAVAICSTYGICVVRISGADTAALTTVGSNSSSTNVNPWSIPVTATGPNSYLFGCVQTGNNTGTCLSTPDANTTEIADLPDVPNGNAQVFVRSTNTGGAGSRTIGGTWDGAQNCLFDAAAIEIKGL